jgi:hypothetical protein
MKRRDVQMHKKSIAIVKPVGVNDRLAESLRSQERSGAAGIVRCLAFVIILLAALSAGKNICPG